MLRTALTDGKHRRVTECTLTPIVITTLSLFMNHAVAAQWKSSDLLTAVAQDFSMDHKDIDLLRLRSFTLGKKLSDEDVVGSKGMDRIAELIACIEPFVSWSLTLLLR